MKYTISSVGTGIKRWLHRDFERNRLNIVVGGWSAFLAHPIYFFVCTTFVAGAYDSAFFRFASAVISIPLLFEKYWPARNKPWLNLYWYLCITFVLPITFTYLLLMNSFSGMWLVCEAIMICVTLVYVGNFFPGIVVLGAGIPIGYFCFYFHTGQQISWTPQLLEYLVPLPVAFWCVTVFSANSKKALLAERSKVWHALASSIAHEMRNPLAQANMSLNSLGDMLPAYGEVVSSGQIPRMRQLVGVGKTAVYRGHQVIDMILGSLKSNVADRSRFGYLSAAQATQKAVDEYGFLGAGQVDARRNLRDSVKVHIVKDFIFHGDETAYVFVLFNLIKNALYYFGQKPEATLVLTVDDHKVTVRDTGPGIADEVLARLFESFMTSGKAEGTGLGLAYCKRTMQSFGGDIRCDSAVGEFTEFTLSFPVLPEADLQACKQAEMEKAAAALQAQVAAPIAVRNELQGKTVILAEDDEDSREMMLDHLHEWGMTVLEAGDGDQVLAHLHATPGVDLILMDMVMPGMNGVQTTRAIRAEDWAHQRIAILALSGNSDEFEIKAAMKAGMNDFIVKSGNMRFLRTKMAAVFSDAEKGRDSSAS